MPLPPPQSSGLAPPMSGPPSQIPGPGKTSREKMMQAARLLFDAIAEEPTLAGDLNEIIESLTTVIRQSAEALGPPPGAPDGIAGTPPLDRTPAGPPSGGPMASPVAGGALPAVIQTLLRGRGM